MNKTRSIFISLITCILFIWPQMAHTKNVHCKEKGIDESGITVENADILWTYSVLISGPDWRTEPLVFSRSLHEGAKLICRGCYSGGLGSGMFFMSSDKKIAETIPRKLSERIERKWEIVLGIGFGFQLGVESLSKYVARDNIKVGDLAGYALRYRIAGEEFRTWRQHFGRPAIKELSFLVVSLSDECMTFEAHFVHATTSETREFPVLDTILRELQITKNTVQ